ncbi:hypothetical protein PFISCL1PPCAC_25598, partial [Pristionchus fissidentatus]
RSPSSLVSLRIDTWIPLIFEKGETIRSADENLASYKSNMVKELSEFSLILTPSYSSISSDRKIAVYRPTEIYSDYLKIGSTSLIVSRELLSLHSDFFS